MPGAEVLKPKHKEALALHLQSLAQASALEGQIAGRAKAIEADLMKEGDALRGRIETAAPFKARRLEKRYLKTMHALAGVRRAYALAKHTAGTMTAPVAASTP